MFNRFSLAVFCTLGIFVTSAAHAECSGTNGRGWGSGKGNGQYQMSAADKSCLINPVSFVNDAKKTSVVASDIVVTKAPKSGKLGMTAKGLVYMPNSGFKGSDKFCTKHTTSKVPGKALSGCVTVSVK